MIIEALLWNGINVHLSPVLSLGIVLLLISIILHSLDKERLSIFFLIGSSIFIFLNAAELFPYLNLWDERFHALVAKNLMHHPLMPTLYDNPIVDYDYEGWSKSHIWLHKQPLFMWQIALSFRIFGVNETALRLPSVMMSCCLVFAGYRSGKLLGNKDVGYYTGMLIVSSYYLMKLISGYMKTDQNDVAFLGYISLSFWAWIEYIYSRNRWWLLIIGIFSGFAILCKWLVGLLIYLAWGIYSIQENKLMVKRYWDLLLSLLITVAIALPWQLLIYYWYPAEAQEESAFTMQHLFTVVEDHGGTVWYHFLMMNEVIGSLALLIIVPGFYIFYKYSKDKKVALTLILTTFFVYLFFTWAKTKMPSFTTVIMLPMFLAIAFLIDFLVRNFYKLNLSNILKRSILVLFLFIIAGFRLDFKELNDNGRYLARQAGCYQQLIYNKKVFQSLNLPPNAVLFNVNCLHYVEAMFYTGIPSYNFIPDYDQYIDMKNKKRTIALFKPYDGILPDYLKNDSTILILDYTINHCE